MANLLLGIDIGTSACKIAVFNLEGKVLATITEEYPVYYPMPGWAEQNAEDWWSSVCKGIRKIVEEKEIAPQDISGIGIDGQSWSCIPVNKNGDVLHNTPIWMDTRADSICKKVCAQIGEDRIFKLSGNPFKPTYTTPKILWFKENMPAVYNNTYKFLQSNSYIAYKLTGNFSQDSSQCYGLHVVNIADGTYDAQMCADMGIDMDKLPAIFPCHQVIGSVNDQAAKQTGLPAGIPVVAGGLDAACGTLGAGVYQAGQTQEQGGQAGGMSICVDEPLGDPALILSCHVVPNVWLLQGGTVGGGASLNWIARELGYAEEEQAQRTGESKFKIIDEEAAKILPGSDGLVFLPYLAGERSPIWDSNAKGVFFGLTFNKTRAHFFRSVMEGAAFALYHNLMWAQQAGVDVNEMYSMGGAANSALWTQIKADITGKTIKVPASDTATTLGAAILAGVGIGLYPSFDAAVKQIVSVKRVYVPNMENHARYQKSYEIYLELYKNLKGTMAKAAEL